MKMIIIKITISVLIIPSIHFQQRSSVLSVRRVRPARTAAIRCETQPCLRTAKSVTKESLWKLTKLCEDKVPNARFMYESGSFSGLEQELHDLHDTGVTYMETLKLLSVF